MVAGVRLTREIKIGPRVRTDISAEVESLAKSIKETGLKYAITIDPDDNLIAGYRRLMAYQAIGWKQIEVNIVKDLDQFSLVMSSERDDQTEREPMSNLDLLAYVASILRLEILDGRSRKSRAISEGNKRRWAGLEPVHEPRPTWAQRAPSEPRTIIGNAIGVSSATVSRLIGIARRLHSNDAIARGYALVAQEEIASGTAIHPAYERMTYAIRVAKHPEKVTKRAHLEKIKAVAPAPEPEPALPPALALAYKLRRRDEMVTAKFQREIVGQAVETATSLVTVFTHIADKINTYGVNEEITSEEQERWLKDITRTRSALNKAFRAIKGGTR